jgi:hypothetical protein
VYAPATPAAPAAPVATPSPSSPVVYNPAPVASHVYPATY